MTKQQYEVQREKTLAYFEKAHIILTQAEKDCLEVADFGLDDIAHTGLQLVTYINTARVCAKEMVLFANQACPEHRHPPLEGYEGKEETFRCRYGTVYLYVEGEATEQPAVQPPENGAEYYTAFHEIALQPGEQYTIPKNTKHWFVGGAQGAVITEFSTPSFDEGDIFTDPRIVRIPKIEE